MAQVGTFCIACAILTLPDVGPRDQPGQDPILLLTTAAAILWGAALTVATVVCCVGMVALARRSRRRRPTSGGVALGVYVTAQVTPSPPSPSPHPNRGPEPAPDPSPCSNLRMQVAPAFLRTSVSTVEGYLVITPCRSPPPSSAHQSPRCSPSRRSPRLCSRC